MAKITGNARAFARKRVLELAHDLQPEFLRTLHQNVLPRFENARRASAHPEHTIELNSPSAIEHFATSVEDDPEQYPPDRTLLIAGDAVLETRLLIWARFPVILLADLSFGLAEEALPDALVTRAFDNAFDAWRQRWGMLDGWQGEEALEQLERWASGECRGRPDKGWVALAPTVTAALDPLRIDYEWDGRGRVEDFIEPIRARAVAYKQALTTAGPKRGVDRERHLRWLARREILGESVKTIAQDESVGTSTVRMAMRETRLLVGLEHHRDGRRKTRPNP